MRHCKEQDLYSLRCPVLQWGTEEQDIYSLRFPVLQWGTARNRIYIVWGVLSYNEALRNRNYIVWGVLSYNETLRNRIYIVWGVLSYNEALQGTGRQYLSKLMSLSCCNKSKQFSPLLNLLGEMGLCQLNNCLILFYLDFL